MVCLDTSFLIALIRRDNDAEEKLELYTRANEEITTTPICASELYSGAYRSQKKETEVKKVKEYLSRIQLLEFSSQACEKFGRVKSELESKGTPVGDFDIMIAAIALTHAQSVLTRDVDHFQKISGLAVETW